MEDFIPTRGAQNRKNAGKLLEVTTYEAHKKVSNPNKVQRKKEKIPSDENSDYDSDEQMDNDDEPMDDRRKQELEMKRFRYDVIKLGMSGFDKKKARQAKIELAISLGAKPPKNRNCNYKKLMEIRKREKAQEAKKKKFASGFNSTQLLMKTKKCDKSKLRLRKDKESSGILGIYGKVTKDNKGPHKGHNKRGGKRQTRQS